MGKKKIILYSLLFIVPILLMSTVVVGHAYWKNSTKNSDVIADQTLYKVILMNNNTQYGEYKKLERDSTFELPELGGTFNGWYLEQDLSGGAYRGYQKLGDFDNNAFNSDNEIIFYS